MSADLPLRMTIEEVAALARCSVATIHRRRKDDPTWLPGAKKFGRRLVFDQAAVLKALELEHGEKHNESGWEFDPDAYREALAREIRDRAATRRRNLPRSVRASAKAAPPRLVADNTTS